MKLAGYLLMTLFLCLGSVAATTAYVPTLDAVAQAVAAGTRITLATGAGVLRDEAGEPVRDKNGALRPLIAVPEEGDPVVVDEALVERLRDAGVERVKVKEFAFGRWSLGWLFSISAAGLIGGAMLVRAGTRREIAQHAAGTGKTRSPRDLLAAIRADLDAAAAQIEGQPPTHVQHVLVERLGELQSGHIDDFVRARPALIGTLGLAGFARVMDRFAIMERQVNRTWSAAADGAVDEALDSFAAARALLPDVEAALEQQSR